MSNPTLFKVVQLVRDTVSVIEQSIELDELSTRYRATLCGCDPLARVYDDDERCIVDYLFYAQQSDGSMLECPDPRMYVDDFDIPTLDHVCPAHRQCLVERSGQIDEYEGEFTLLI